MIELHVRYREGKDRVSALVRSLDPAAIATPVPACPGWTVLGTLTHLVSNADDGVAGRIGGPPDDAQTAAQLAARRHLDVDGLLAMWEATFPAIEHLISAAGPPIAPIVIDLLTHEQDILGALGRQSHRDSDDIAWAAHTLLDRMVLPRPTTITTEHRTHVISPDAPGTPLQLTTTAWDVLRLRLGRRSRPQALALAWSSNPSDVIDNFFVFGPTPVDIVE